jgi:membrane-associated protease RseP (regulator of RpoE activity)
MHWQGLALLAAARAFVLPKPPRQLHLRAAEDDCVTAEECSAEAEVLKLKAETMKLEAQKAELLLAKEVAERQRREREEEEALRAMSETEAAAKVVDPVQAAALRDADFQAKVLERRDEASRKLVAEAAAEEQVPIASDVAKTIAGPVLISDCETVEECAIEESASKEEASLLSLEAEKLRLEAQKAELVLARQRLERTAKQEAEAFIEGTLDPVVVEEEAEEVVEVITPESVACEEALDGLFPAAPLTMTREAAEVLRKALFDDEKGFRCDAVDVCERGAIFRGSTRNQATRELLAKCVARCPSDYRLFALEDPVPPTDEEVEARLQDARDRALLDKDIADGSPDAPPNELMAAARRPTVIIAVASETRPLQIESKLGLATRLAGLVGTAGSAAAFSAAAGAGNEQLFERLKDGDETAFACVLPIAVGIFAILAVHECAHAVLARRGSVDWSLPVFLPSLSTGSLGASNELNEYAPTRSSLFDTAIAGPLAGLALSILFVLIGSALPLDAATAPALPAIAIRSSALGSLLVAIGAPSALSAAPDVSVALHPLVVAGLAGLAINALALLPLGRTDGGRCALTAYGRTLGAGLQGFATLFVGLAALFGGDDLLLFHLLWVFGLQRDPESPCVDEVTDAEGRRPVYALALIVAGLCLLPLAPAAPSTVLPGFPSL